MKNITCAFAIFLLAPCFCSAAPPATTAVSFNIRVGAARDGENSWKFRKDNLVKSIKTLSPDLLGTQETLPFQRDFLAQQLPEYSVFGVGREDGREKGEIMAIFWRTERFEKLDGGHFWLSETPEDAGSKSWDSSLPRMATWVQLRDRLDEDAQPIYFINTHFDHRGPDARLQSANLIRKRIGELGRGCSVILTGDFNANEGSPPYRAMFAERAKVKSPLVDTFRTVHSLRGDNEGTWSAFKADHKSSRRIDWIGCSRDWTIKKAGIDRKGYEGRYPSDHYAVFAVLTR
ncbi:endonuclease/exonuclease/phosphatase family protein [Stratiformator vulcanicus]|uniref:Endonuclease/Exonuclease/phosphatase family protein n=1 Tax=Stratiformator vulcanicus TaxID=2527980 RepID=A0A517QZU4_9PLAN|nr:endonuclease/exonuclease/phosphatase family protein [Stratiformator vulcanicus]QDT37138.1 Endonuclease/Exonuclease/phosphatase family protein [Stratiformator vulcanicus]